MWEVGHLEINNLPVIKSAFSLEEPKSGGRLLSVLPPSPSLFPGPGSKIRLFSCETPQGKLVRQTTKTSHIGVHAISQPSRREEAERRGPDYKPRMECLLFLFSGASRRTPSAVLRPGF